MTATVNTNTDVAVDADDWADGNLVEVTSPPVEETAAALTVREFFNGLELGTFVKFPRARTEFIFWGFETEDDGTNTVAVIHSRYMSRELLNSTDMDEENRWETVKLADDTVKTTSPEFRYALRQMMSLRGELEQYGENVRTLQKSLQESTEDFLVVNAKLNEFAVDRQYCTDYEYYISQWNQELKVHKLFGRPRNHDVAIRFKLGDAVSEYAYVRVEARSDDEAKEMVSGMSIQEVMRRLVESGSYFCGLSAVVVGAETEDDD